jgi:hypothetical protein
MLTRWSKKSQTGFRCQISRLILVVMAAASFTRLGANSWRAAVLHGVCSPTSYRPGGATIAIPARRHGAWAWTTSHGRLARRPRLHVSVDLSAAGRRPLAAMEHDYANYNVTGHPRPHQTYSSVTTNITTNNGPASSTTNTGPGARSPLTGHDPNFLNGLLPFYDPPSPQREPSHTYYHNFYEAALRPSPSPSPPPPNFLDNILNPAGLSHNRYLPFGYQLSPPTFRPPYVTGHDMPPSTRAHPQAPSRPARLPNGYVDLTATPDSPPQRRKRQSPAAGPSAKRQKRGDDTGATGDESEGARIEEVDLTDDKPSVHAILQKQREDAVKSQTKPEEKPTTFNNFNCVICMDMPTDLTATACGAYLRSRN